MEYRVKFAPDALMPSNDMWCFARDSDTLTLYVRESAMICTVEQKEHFLEEMWAAFRAMEAGKVIPIPQQRETADA